jgi:hypothetical protein
LPKIRFSNLPRGIWQHLLDRVQQRDISLADLSRLQEWVKSEPYAPDGDWYKDFGSFKVCGSGEYPNCPDPEHESIRQRNRVSAPTRLVQTRAQYEGFGSPTCLS